VVLWSASGQDSGLLWRQVVRLGIAFGCWWRWRRYRPRCCGSGRPGCFSPGWLLLFAVLVAGDFGKGAQRWLDLGFIRFQPSEIMKLAVPMMAAWYLHDRPLPPRFVELLRAAGLVVVPALLIAQQPDLGTALLVAAPGCWWSCSGACGLRLILLLGGWRRRWRRCCGTSCTTTSAGAC
jgi:rod shape determining protein RodA